ncbi:unnamed protein product [Paramecium octaurelia]|uniref:Uncharacterized protein n=1 Tax=Paramecium octaurelia TaxID=43137 RepID=A0A8S1VM07_PAROT|nr:unnamed protein product [Paramecium octaurelia]
MSQISEFLQYQIKLRENKLPYYPEEEKKNKEKAKKKIQNHKIPKNTKDSAYKFYTKPSEFPNEKDGQNWRMVKFKSLFQSTPKYDQFV